MRDTATFLGQAGVRLVLNGVIIYVDPYLTDAVGDKYGAHLRRRVSPPIEPARVTDADWVLITHEHEDHADPATLRPIAEAVPSATFMCPEPALRVLRSAGIDDGRAKTATEVWTPVGRDVSVRAVPAAHPTVERDEAGRLKSVGYLIRCPGRLIFHAGDTMPHEELFQAVLSEGSPDWAFLPVNERNYFKDAAGIVGNMSIREAFQTAERLHIRHVVPTHWDLFQANGVLPEEIELVYQDMHPSFALHLTRAGETEDLT